MQNQKLAIQTFRGQALRGQFEDENAIMFIDLYIKYGSKRRSELVQKIGAILDENTSVLKENDYRVCMDTLMELM